jgi:hypothetical protein
MSQLLKRLQRELSTCTDPLARAELLARISGNLARIGNFDEARQCIAELRRDYAGPRSGPATVWIMLAEGLLHLFSDLNPSALDRVKRAQILGLAMRYPAAVALSSAWKAHLEFEKSQFDEMVLSIRIGLEHADEDDHDSQVRIAMVLANAFMVSGDRINSQVWFAKARTHAISNGDQASIEALLYNRTAFSIASIRSDRCMGCDVQIDLTITRKEVESATNLQELTRIGALTNHMPLWSARLSILERNFPRAISELEISRQGAPFADYNFSQQMIDLETVYCLAKIGKIDQALLVFEAIDLDSIGSLDLDEQLAAASMQYELDLISDRFSRGIDTLVRFEQLKSKYASSRYALRSSLEEWSA